jgi:RNA polymerase sigma factor (sigma-70 family)
MCIIHPLDVTSPTIFVCAQAGCVACLEALLERHRGLVKAILRRQWGGDLAYADLLQEGMLGLWRAIMKYDPSRGVAFSTYAGVAIARHMWRAVYVAQRRTRWQPASYTPQGVYEESEVVKGQGAIEDGIGWQQAGETLLEMVMALPEPQREVVLVHYGLDGGPARSMAALSRWYGVSREAVRIWRNNALAQLRMPFFSTPLRALCDREDRQAYAQAQMLNRSWLGRQRRNKR